MRTWKQAKKDFNIDCIEHPLSSCLIPKFEFEHEFNTLLYEFDRTTASDYFDFYFIRCTINRTAYRFRDDDCKQYFIDACISNKKLGIKNGLLMSKNKRYVNTK